MKKQTSIPVVVVTILALLLPSSLALANGGFLLWQVGTPDGAVNPIDGSDEYPATGVWTEEFNYAVPDGETTLSPVMPGYIGLANVCNFAGDRPCTDTTALLNLNFDLDCDYDNLGELIFYYDRYGSESDDLYFDLELDGEPFDSISATEGGFRSFSYDMVEEVGGILKGSHTISIKYAGGGSGNGHYIDYMKLVSMLDPAACVNQPPVADPNGPYLGPVNTDIAFDGRGSSDPDDDDLTYAWDFGETNTGSGATPSHSYDTPGIYDVCLTVNDGFVDSAEECTTAVVYDPSGGFVTGGGWFDSPAGAMAQSADVLLSGPLADVGWGGDYLRNTSVVCDPNNTPITIEGWVDVSDLTDNGALLIGLLDKKWIDDGNSGFFTGAYAYFGRRGTNLRIGPSDGNTGGELNQVGANVLFDPWEMVNIDFSMVIYNGEVTVSFNGSDYLDTYGDVPSDFTWNEFEFGAYPGVDLWSPEGSVNYEATVSGCEISPTGKATFGFVSKYKKGADVPTGNTEFQFKAGDLNFHSSDYDWLVVTGSNYARFKGIGTINGEGEYKFMIWAGDGTSSNGEDTFRIKIWYEEGENEVVVYDNDMDQEIGGGSIVVHTKK